MTGAQVAFSIPASDRLRAVPRHGTRSRRCRCPDSPTRRRTAPTAATATGRRRGPPGRWGPVDSHDPAQTLVVAALIPTYAGTSISSLSPQTEILPIDEPRDDRPGAGRAVGLPQLPPNRAPASSTPASSTPRSPTCGPAAADDLHRLPRGLRADRLRRARSPPTALAGVGRDEARRRGLVGRRAHHHGRRWPPTAASCHASPSGTVAGDLGDGRCGTGAGRRSTRRSTPRAAPSRRPASTATPTRGPAACSRPRTAALPAGRAPSTTAPRRPSATAPPATPAARPRLARRGRAAASTSPAAPPRPPACRATRASGPPATAGWISTDLHDVAVRLRHQRSGVTHGDGQDCAVCHAGPGTGAWGGHAELGRAAHFAHGPATSVGDDLHRLPHDPAARPAARATAAAMAALLGFDHALNGTGDCFGCHQATVTAGHLRELLQPGDARAPRRRLDGRRAYPGATLVERPRPVHHA